MHIFLFGKKIGNFFWEKSKKRKIYIQVIDEVGYFTWLCFVILTKI